MAGVDAGELERGRLDVGPVERLDMATVGLARVPAAPRVADDHDRGNLQQRVGSRVEAAGLDVDDHREIASKAISERCCRRSGGVGHRRGTRSVRGVPRQ